MDCSSQLAIIFVLLLIMMLIGPIYSLISLKSKKQACVPKFSTKFKYHAMLTACFEISNIVGFWLSLIFLKSNPTPLHTVNTSTILIATNPVYHECMKHIKVNCHFIRKALDTLVISLHVFIDLQIADIFMKAMKQ